MKIEDTDELGW